MTTPPYPAMVSAFRGSRARSALYRWLWDNFEPLQQARKASQGVTDWVGVTLELNHIGLRNRDGKLLKPESVRRTFARVERDRARQTPPPTAAPLPVPFADIPSPLFVPQTLPATPVLPAMSGLTAPARFNFAVARPRPPKDKS
jgi:hypothetical protein